MSAVALVVRSFQHAPYMFIKGAFDDSGRFESTSLAEVQEN
jgi:hypothetical protein